MQANRASVSFTKLIIVLVLVLQIFLLLNTSILLRGVQATSEYDTYVHNFVNTPRYGNWTFMEKPMFPIHFNQSQIPVGSNWTVVSPLTANHTYHVYFYGKWVDEGSKPSTDYDVYVYNSLGELEGYHTESSGVPEHLGAPADKPFFIPKYSGNYSFVLRNDPRESKASEPATFMIIEDVECNKWQEVYVEGKENSIPVFNTSRAFEFVTESQRVEVLVKVPEALDMYEARLYLMANPKAGKGQMLNDVPLAWEEGLYGEIQQIYGGYNAESKESRGLAYASCEFFGQDMLINCTSTVQGKSLYHLVFIGEKGAGKIDFLVKTEFAKARLDLANHPSPVYPNTETNLTLVSNTTDLTKAALNYSVNNWTNSTALGMQLLDNRTCTAIVPGQPAGTTVRYEITASDVLENTLVYWGNYSVKYASQLNLTLKAEAISIGDNITLTGLVTPFTENLTITLMFSSSNGTFPQTAYTLDQGTFTASFKPSTQGDWMVQATFKGNNMLYESSSPSLKFRVNPPSFLSQYSMYIYAGAGAGAGTVIIAFVYIKKRRE